MLYCTSQPWDNKILDFSLVLNTLLNGLSSKCTVNLQMLVLETYSDILGITHQPYTGDV